MVWPRKQLSLVGDHVRFYCRVGVFHSWKFEKGKPIQLDNAVPDTDGTVFFLTVYNITKKNEGNYKCYGQEKYKLLYIWSSGHLKVSGTYIIYILFLVVLRIIN